jgi:rare lipoprotein A
MITIEIELNIKRTIIFLLTLSVIGVVISHTACEPIKKELNLTCEPCPPAPVCPLCPPCGEPPPPDVFCVVSEEGDASYYGPYDSYSRMTFHGRRTASGEIFDMNDPTTAAHFDLPFGTIVTVVNLKNNKAIEVRINDRGPYKLYRNEEGKVTRKIRHPHRVIDLSMAAAKRLDIVGIAPVRISWREKVKED